MDVLVSLIQIHMSLLGHIILLDPLTAQYAIADSDTGLWNYVFVLTKLVTDNCQQVLQDLSIFFFIYIMALI